MKIIQISKTGGPEVMELVDVPVPTPGPKQALVKVAASGVNFIDVYFRIGLYKADLPFTPGNEASGTVEAVGSEVTEVQVGDRVAYAMHRGSYAEYTVVPSAQLVKLPDHVDFRQGAAAMLQGMTAHYLTHSSFPLKKGDTCLIHAAAGGAGRLAVQMAKMLGATVYGTAGTDEKAAIAKSAGADEVIVYTRQDFVAEVKKLTGGKGLDVVYDSVGESTFLKNDGIVWAVERRGIPVRSVHPESERIAVSHAPQPCPSLSHPRGVAVALGRRAGLDCIGPTGTANRQDLCIGRRSAGTPRSGRPQNCREIIT